MCSLRRYVLRLLSQCMGTPWTYVQGYYMSNSVKLCYRPVVKPVQCCRELTPLLFELTGLRLALQTPVILDRCLIPVVHYRRQGSVGLKG